MKNKSIIVMGIVISIGLTACNSEMVVNNTDVVEVMAQVETSQAIEEETTTEVESVIEEETTTEADSVVESYVLEEMNKEMVVEENASTYGNPDGKEKKSVVQEGEVIKVVGKVVGKEWYKIEQEGEIGSYIEGKYLGEIPVEEESQPETPQPEVKPETQPETPQPEVKPETPQPEVKPETQPETPQPQYNDDYTGPGINPATGQDWQPGDRLADGSIYMGSFGDASKEWGSW